MNRLLYGTPVMTLLLSALLVAGCAANTQAKTLDLTLSQYEKIIRWSQWDAAVDFLAPEYLERQPVTTLDLDRLRLFRVTQYNIRSTLPAADGMQVTQVIEIRMFNRNRAVERAVLDRQEWRYDPERERWFLHSGLPDVTRAR